MVPQEPKVLQPCLVSEYPDSRDEGLRCSVDEFVAVRTSETARKPTAFNDMVATVHYQSIMDNRISISFND
jgi:hypothetical protein